MSSGITILICLSVLFVSHSQNDTINQRDENNCKQGYWILYGKDKPEKGYPSEGRIEEGVYRNNRKEGKWIRYFNDGRTPKLIFHYKNNRPSGSYEKRYRQGGIKESGDFSQGKYIGQRLTYFENGIIKSSTSFDSLGREIDSTIYNFENGCRQLMIIYSFPGVVSSTIEYKEDSCNLPLTVETVKGRLPKLDSVAYLIESTIMPEIEIQKKKGTTRITYELIIRDGRYFIEELTVFTMSNDEKKTKREIPVRNISRTKGLNGYHKLVNFNDEVFIDGEFKGGFFLNGKVYIYDEDGILLWVKVYKNGNYRFDGRL